jgi:hypothetical protein
MSTRLLAYLVIGTVAAISSWIIGLRMKRRIKKALGIEIENEVELTSLNTWMRVEDEEERSRGGKPS